MFGGSSQEMPEESIFDAKSPYGASKVFAHEIKFIEILTTSLV